jgi:hypothetical protein
MPNTKQQEAYNQGQYTVHSFHDTSCNTLYNSIPFKVLNFQRGIKSVILSVQPAPFWKVQLIQDMMYFDMLCRGQENVDLYIHSPIRLHGVVLN